jgi:hypothetical protein
MSPMFLLPIPYILASNPSGHIDQFNNPIPAPDAFEEGNMANISPTFKIDISIKPGIIEEITIGVACSPEKLTTYKALF